MKSAAVNIYVQVYAQLSWLCPGQMNKAEIVGLS